MVTHVSSLAISFSELFPLRALRMDSISQFFGAWPASSSSSPCAPSGCSSAPWSWPPAAPISTAKVSATSMGSLTPVDSTTIASNVPAAARSASSLMRSSRSVQQMHPLCSSTIFASCWMSLVSLTKLASMLTSAMSFTNTATFFVFSPSLAWCRMFRNSVVLPAPRKPDRTVTGMGLKSEGRPIAAPDPPWGAMALASLCVSLLIAFAESRRR
mmetsp:Transcript_462/g.1757  ORF Transcript_462/g.1757 Transcript_462/m.1757 type:complete len:214 (-) Transcript_462:20-661(-)